MLPCWVYVCLGSAGEQPPVDGWLTITLPATAPSGLYDISVQSVDGEAKTLRAVAWLADAEPARDGGLWFET